MAGNRDRQRISAASPRHSAKRGGFANRRCNLAIGARLARRDRPQPLPNQTLKRRATNIKRHIEARRMARIIDQRDHLIHQRRKIRRRCGKLGLGKSLLQRTEQRRPIGPQ
jgi:hypothetical protein